MNYLAREYWISHTVQEVLTPASQYYLQERNYRPLLQLSDLSVTAQKIIICNFDEALGIVKAGLHQYALCLVFSENVTAEVLPSGEESIFLIDQLDLLALNEMIQLYEVRVLKRVECLIEERINSDYEQLLKTVEGALPPRGRSLNKDYQAVFSNYLSWAPVFLGAENSERLSFLIREKASDHWADLSLRVFLSMEDAYRFSLSGGHIVAASSCYLGWSQEQERLSILHSLVLTLHIELIHAYMSDEKKRDKIVRASQFWEDVLDRLVDPVALLSLEGDLLICNHAFSRSGFLPKECLKLKDTETTQKRNQYFCVTKRSLNFTGEEHIFILLEQAQAPATSPISGRGAGEELGIISSSLAHELKNPIAGILAASSLLSYQDNLTGETLAQIKEMQQSAKRCQNLIEIFLGFSKVETPHGYQTSMMSALSHAFELLKFRMIETDVRLELKPPVESEIYWDVNSSVASMIFYLILSEVMTYAAHERLVASQVSDYCLSLKTRIDRDSFVLDITPALQGSVRFEEHKLLKHLLEWEALQIIVSVGRITLVKGGN